MIEHAQFPQIFKAQFSMMNFLTPTTVYNYVNKLTFTCKLEQSTFILNTGLSDRIVTFLLIFITQFVI